MSGAAPRRRLAALCPDLPLAGAGDLSIADPGTLAQGLAAMERGAPGLDARGQAAFLLGTGVYWQASALFALHLGAGLAPAPGAAPASFRLGAEGELRLDLPGPVVPAAPAERRARMRAALLATAEPLLVPLNAATGFGPGAAWRIVSDSIASGALWTGRRLGREARARADALAMLGGAPLDHRARPTGFHVLRAGGGAPVAHLRRAGCCRYYTAREGSLCAGCVLRSAEEQEEQLRAAS